MTFWSSTAMAANDRWYVPPGGAGITTRGTDGPAWSPDGRQFAYVQDGLLVRIPVTAQGEPDGPVTRLSTELAGVPTWSADGRTILYQATDGLRRVDVASGAVTPVDVPLTWKPQHPSAPDHGARGALLGRRGRQGADQCGHRRSSGTGSTASSRMRPGGTATAWWTPVGVHGDPRSRGCARARGVRRRRGTRPHLARVRDHDGRAIRRRSPSRCASAARRWRAARASGHGRSRPGCSSTERGSTTDTTTRSPPARTWGSSSTAPSTLDFSLIKTYVRLDDAEQARIITFAHAHGIPVSSHELYPSVASGGDHVEHMSGTSRRGYSPKMSSLSRSYEDVTELLIASGMSLTPTMALQGGFELVARRDLRCSMMRASRSPYGAEYTAADSRRSTPAPTPTTGFARGDAGDGRVAREDGDHRRARRRAA